jgi:hypothetical protein
MSVRIRDEDLLDPQRESDDADLALLLAMAAEQEPSGAALEPGPAPERAGPPALPSRSEELAKIYASRAPRSGPGSEEMELLRNYKPRPSWQNTLANIGAAIAESTGSQGAIARTHAGQRAESNRFAQLLEMARERDRASAPVDRGTAELLAMGGMSPEAAAAVTMGSPAIKLAASGMGQLPARYEQMRLTDEQKRATLESRTADLERRLGAQAERQQFGEGKKDERQDKAIASQKELAAMRKKGAGGGAPMTPEQKAELDNQILDLHASYLADSASAGSERVPRETAKAFLTGTLEPGAVSPNVLERFQSDQSYLTALRSGDQKKYMELIKLGAGRESRNVDQPAVGRETKQLDPKARLALREEVSSVGRDIALADRAWRAMSDDGKKAFAKLAGNGGDLAQLVKSGALSPEDQRNAAAVQALANQLIKARSGSAVTGSEWNRVAAEIGFPQGDWSIFNSPSVIGNWIERAKGGWVRRKKTVATEYPDLWGGNGGP